MKKWWLYEVVQNNHLVIFFVELMRVLTIGLDASSSMFMSLMSCRVGGPRTSTISTNWSIEDSPANSRLAVNISVQQQNDIKASWARIQRFWKFWIWFLTDYDTRRAPPIYFTAIGYGAQYQFRRTVISGKRLKCAIWLYLLEVG